jgi:hypothetical protein
VVPDARERESLGSVPLGVDGHRRLTHAVGASGRVYLVTDESVVALRER